jgi:hypothetical protein
MQTSDLPSELWFIDSLERQSVEVELGEIKQACGVVVGTRSDTGERCGHCLHLFGKVVAEIAIEGCPALQISDAVGSRIRFDEGLRADHANNDEEHDNNAERGEKLCADGRADPRDRADEVPYVFSSFRSCLK